MTGFFSKEEENKEIKEEEKEEPIAVVNFLEEMKWCKHCEEHHPVTEDFWGFRNSKPYRCKVYRKRQYHELGGKEKMAADWKVKSQEEINKINEERRKRYLEGKKKG